MPNLALPIEGYEEQPVADPNGYALPVAAEPFNPELKRVVIDTGPKLKEVEHDPWATGKSAIDKLLGLNGQERYQLWPEKLIRSGVTAAGDALSGNIPQYQVDPVTGDVHTSPQMIERAMDMSAVAGTGGLAGADASLGSGPMLRPALKYKDKIYKAPVGGQHLDALPPSLYNEFQKLAMSGEDINHYNFGFMNHKGQFLSREAALDYAVKEGLVDPQAGQYGALTSTLLADSSKPGVAIESLGKSGKTISIDKLPKEVQSDIAYSLMENVPVLKKYANGRIEDIEQLIVGAHPTIEVPDKIINSKNIDIANRTMSKAAVDKYASLKTKPPHVVMNGGKLMEGGHRVAAAQKNNKNLNAVDISQLLKGNWDSWLDGGTLLADSSKPGTAIEAMGKSFKVKGHENEDWFHGTTHDFDKFKVAKGNIENYGGKYPHFTSNAQDASANYAGHHSPDLTGRIERRAEELVNDKDLNWGTPEYKKAMDEAKAKATKEIAGTHEGAIIPANIKMEKPADITPEGKTWIDFNPKLDKEGEWVKDHPNMEKLSNSLKKQGEKYGFDGEKAFQEVAEKANLYEGDIKASDLHKALKDSEELMYAEHPEGKGMVGSHVAATVFKDLGFDGIVMDAHYAFPNMKIEKGTKHAIVLKPNTVQSKLTGQTLFNKPMLIPVDHDPFATEKKK